MIPLSQFQQNGDKDLNLTNPVQKDDTLQLSYKNASSNIYRNLEEKAKLIKKNKNKLINRFLANINPFSGMSATRISICILISIPFFCMLILCIASFLIILNQSNQILDKYIDNLYQEKQTHSKIQNNAILIQLNSQLQNIAWHSYVIDKLQRKLLYYGVYISRDFENSIWIWLQNQRKELLLQIIGNIIQNTILCTVFIQLNISEIYSEIDIVNTSFYSSIEGIISFKNYQQYYFRKNKIEIFLVNKILFVKSQFFVVFQYHLQFKIYRQSKAFNEGGNIDKNTTFYLYFSSIVNVIERPVLFNSMNERQGQRRKISVQDIFFGFSYEGLFLSNFISSAYEEIPYRDDLKRDNDDTCPFIYNQAQDIRTFEWFTKSIENRYLSVIQPKIYKDPCSQPFIASLICLRSSLAFSNNKVPFSVLCNVFEINQMKQFFSEYSLYSDFTLVVDPTSLKVVYDSQSNDSNSFKIKSLKEYDFFEDDQDEDSQNLTKTYTLIDQIQDFFNQINEEFTTHVDLIKSFDAFTSQKVISHIKNGKEYEVIVNAVQVYSKIKYTAQNGYQLVTLFMFLDVLSKETLISDGVKLKEKVELMQLVQMSCYLVIMLAFLVRATKHALQKSNLIDIPVIRLTELIRRIQFQSLIQKSSPPNDNDMVDIDSLDEISDQFQSSETRILFESFQNLFNMLRFTTQELYQQNDGMALLNLCNQVKYFEKFKNIRALGICHNNIGNIHFNNQRYIESLQEYQRAIIYSQYELKYYCSIQDQFGFAAQSVMKQSSNMNVKKSKKDELQKYNRPYINFIIDFHQQSYFSQDQITKLKFQNNIQFKMKNCQQIYLKQNLLK